MRKYKRYFGLILLILCPTITAQEWTYSKDTDDFEDVTIHLARVSAIGGDGYAVARCDGGLSFDLIFSIGEFIGSSDSYGVRWRIDKNDPEAGKWGVSTEGTSVFVSNRDKVVLAQQLLTGSEFLLEVTDYRGTSHQKRFALSGSNNTIRKVMEACQVSTEEVAIDGVEDAVIQQISMWGPKNTQCKKRMLSSLGYQITDSTPSKTNDVYIALQKYMDQKYNVCEDGTATTLEKSYECKQKDRFLTSLYKDAVSKNNAFKEECGSLYMGD